MSALSLKPKFTLNYINLELKNNLKSQLHRLYKTKETKKHILQYLFLEITKKCNLNCLHCGSDCSKNVNSPELSTDSWFKIISYFKKQFSSSLAFIITGGEPLMHPDILKIGDYINKEGMRWGMVTNGMLLNNSKLGQLIKAGISSITLSLDGLEESHNWLRNHPQAFEKTLMALQLIAKSKILLKDVVTCVSPKNLKELDQIAALLIENKIPDWRLFRIFPSGRAHENDELELSFEQTKEMTGWIAANKNQLYKQGLNVNLSCEGWVPFEQDIKLRDYSFFCRSGINIASILADGTITGCSNNSEGFHVGNILKDNFRNLWENNFDIFRKKEWLKDTLCSNCVHIKDCRGSSIHLWQMGDVKPGFCYAVDVKKL